MKSTTMMIRGAVVAAMIASCGAAFAQSAPASPTPPTAPRPAAAPRAQVQILRDVPLVDVRTDAAWTITSVEDGRTISLQGKGEEITATIDGQSVPADRIERQNDLVRIKDEQGKVIFEQVVVKPSLASVRIGDPSMMQVRPYRGRWQGEPMTGAIAVAPAETPKVMIGVQLAEPDSSLRGHLGLKEGETTLISGVYEGLPAHGAGIEPYDIIVAIDGATPADPGSVRKALRDKEPGQSVAFDVIHKGQKKTVTITLEKYDEEKMDKAKVNAIALAAGDAEDVFQSLAIAPSAPGGQNRAWAFSRSGPIVGGTLGPDGKTRNQIFYRLEDDANLNHAEIARRAEEMAQKMAAQADEMVRNWEKSGNAAEMNKRMEERMRKLEEMLREMMERQEKAAPEPGKGGDKQSGLAPARKFMS